MKPERTSTGLLILRTLLLGAVAVYALRYLGLALNRWPNLDELQSLVNAFDAARGLRLYLDFWDNHGPALTWLLTPLIKWWPDDHNVFFVARAGAWGCLMLSAMLVYKLAASAFEQRPVLPAAAALLFLLSVPVMGHGIEIRPDNASVALWAGCLLAITLGLKSGALRWWIAAGLLLGACATFTLKVLPLCAGVVLLLAGARLVRMPIRWRNVLAMGAAFAAVLAGMVAALWLIGTLRAWYVCVLQGNVERGSMLELTPLGEPLEQAPIWVILTVASCGWAAVRLARRRGGPEALFVGSALLLMFQFTVLLPTKFLTSLLTAQVPQAVLNAWLLCEVGATLARRIPHPLERLVALQMSRRAGIAVLLGAVALGVHWEQQREQLYYARFYSREAGPYVDFANRVASRFGRSDYGFDPSGYVFLRPKPGVFHVLVTFIRRLHNDETVDLGIPGLLQFINAKYIVFSARANDLRAKDHAFVRSAFVPLEDAPVARSEVTVAVAGRPGDGEHHTRIPVSARYVAWEKRGKGWKRHAVGWREEGSAIGLRPQMWLIAPGNHPAENPGPGFGDWTAYQETPKPKGRNGSRTEPKWYLDYLALPRSS